MLTRPDLPLAHLEEAGSIFDGVIAEHDARYHLSYVGIAAGRLAISLRAAPVGQAVRVRIDARDVSLALEPPQHTSITNILPGRVMDVTDDRDPAQRLVRIDVTAPLRRLPVASSRATWSPGDRSPCRVPGTLSAARLR